MILKEHTIVCIYHVVHGLVRKINTGSWYNDNLSLQIINGFRVQHQDHLSVTRVSTDTRAPFHWRIFHRNSNSMEISFHSHLDSNTVIATKFCTWHDSCAVVACAKLCCDLMASNGIMARRSFHRIWIAGKKTLVKRAPVYTQQVVELMQICPKERLRRIIWQQVGLLL